MNFSGKILSWSQMLCRQTRRHFFGWEDADLRMVRVEEAYMER
jgi:hypothetical protein